MRATLSYNGTVLTETVTDTVTGATYTNNYTANIPSLVAGNIAYVGFGGGTGAATVTQDLQSWTYTVQSLGQAAPRRSLLSMERIQKRRVSDCRARPRDQSFVTTQPEARKRTAPMVVLPEPYIPGHTVSSSETLYAIAGGSGYGDSSVASASYVIQSPTATQAASPGFSPAGGTYSAAQSVIVASSSSGAVVCYNTTGSPKTNGSNGCSSGTLYTGAVKVSSSETLYAVAGGTGYNDSPVASATYISRLRHPRPQPNPSSIFPAASPVLLRRYGWRTTQPSRGRSSIWFRVLCTMPAMPGLRLLKISRPLPPLSPSTSIAAMTPQIAVAVWGS